MNAEKKLRKIKFSLTEVSTLKIKEKPAVMFYKDIQNLQFPLLLPANQYTNLNSLHLCFLIKISKRTDVAQNIRDNLITVSNFFVHWMKELNIHEQTKMQIPVQEW